MLGERPGSLNRYWTIVELLACRRPAMRKVCADNNSDNWGVLPISQITLKNWTLTSCQLARREGYEGHAFRLRSPRSEGSANFQSWQVPNRVGQPPVVTTISATLCCSGRTTGMSLLIINALALEIADAVTLRLAGMCLAQRWHIAGLRALMLWTRGTSANVRARQNLP